MDKLYGLSFRNLRQGKGILIKEIVSEELSSSTISSFERGKNDISASKLFIGLSAMNITVEEFLYEYNRLLGKESFPNQILFPNSYLQNAHLLGNIPKLENLVTEIEESLSKDDSNTFLRLYKIFVQSIIWLHDNKQVPLEKDINFLVNYLKSIEKWSRLDMQIISQTLFFLPKSTVDDISNEFIHSNKFLNNYEKTNLNYFIALNNLTDFYLIDNQLDRAKKLLDYYDTFNLPDEIAARAKIYFSFNKAIYDYKSGKKEKGKAKMIQVIDALKVISCFDLATLFFNDMNKLLSEEE